MKRVAVVIPLYNHASYIGDAIRSVLEQTRAVDQIVIVDDGSTDNSVEIVRALAEPRIELLTQPNSGAHSAINRGIQQAADSDYVAILNSDDLFAPERISKCSAFLEETPEIAVVATQFKAIDGNGYKLTSSDPSARWFAAAWSVRAAQLDLVEQLGIANFVASSSNLVGRRTFFLEHPFRSYRYAHDYFFLLDCALHGRLAILDEELLSYRVHSTNTIAAPSEELVRELLEMNVDLLVAVAPELPGSPDLRRALAAYHRAAWSNISSFRADVFLSVVAQVLTKCGGNQTEAAIDAVMNFAEAREFPNQAFVDFHTDKKEFGMGLSEKYSRVRAELLRAKSELSVWRTTWRESGWLRLGRRLGIKSARQMAKPAS